MSVSREEILNIAQAIIKEELDIIQGCRMLVPHIHAVGLADDPDGIVIRGFESETDDLPVGDQRAQWLPESLHKWTSCERSTYLGLDLMW